MKNIAVAPVILEDGRLSFCVPGDDGPPWSGVWNLTGKIVLDGDDYIYESIGHLVGWCFFRGEMEVAESAREIRSTRTRPSTSESTTSRCCAR